MNSFSIETQMVVWLSVKIACFIHSFYLINQRPSRPSYRFTATQKKNNNTWNNKSQDKAYTRLILHSSDCFILLQRKWMVVAFLQLLPDLGYLHWDLPCRLGLFLRHLVPSYHLSLSSSLSTRLENIPTTPHSPDYNALRLLGPNRWTPLSLGPLTPIK